MSNVEQILVVPAALAIEAVLSCGAEGLPSNDGFFTADDSILSMFQEKTSFVPRPPAEDDPSLKQLIVYALVSYRGSYLRYKRGKVGGEARLHAKRSIGIGGHINPEDWDLGATGTQAFRSALTRELQEEVGILESHIADVRLLGLVNEDSTDVGRVHLGLVYFVELSGVADLKFEEALVDPVWADEADLRADDSLELWSLMVRDALFPAPTTLPVRPAFQLRVIDEQAELHGRRKKLTEFLETQQFVDLPEDEQARLVRQHALMGELSDVLCERIAAFA